MGDHRREIVPAKAPKATQLEFRVGLQFRFSITCPAASHGGHLLFSHDRLCEHLGLTETRDRTISDDKLRAAPGTLADLFVSAFRHLRRPLVASHRSDKSLLLGGIPA